MPVCLNTSNPTVHPFIVKKIAGKAQINETYRNLTSSLKRLP